MATRPITGLSICAGVGGLDLGLKLALGEQYRTVCYVERDAYCAAVLVARMADKALDQAPIWDDLTTFAGKRWRGKVDLVSAGFPCQPASAAGQRKGREDDRWLWPAIAQLICEVGSRYVFLENVRGLLSVDDGHAFGEVLGDLADLGFDAEWGVFRASDVGAPHRRERVFVLAYAGRGCLGWDSGTTSSTQAEDGGRGAQDGDGARSICEAMVNHDLPRPGGRSEPEQERRDELPAWPPGPSDDAGWRRVLAVRPDLAPAVEPELYRSFDGMAPRMDRLRAAGNGVVSQQAAAAFCELWGRVT